MPKGKTMDDDSNLAPDIGECPFDGALDRLTDTAGEAAPIALACLLNCDLRPLRAIGGAP